MTAARPRALIADDEPLLRDSLERLLGQVWPELEVVAKARNGREAIDLFEQVSGPDTTLIPGHGTLIKKKDLQPYRAMLVDIIAKVKALRAQGKSLKEVLAANLTAPYDATTQGDTQQSKDRFITEVYDEVQDFPPVVDGKRAMPRRP